MNTFEIIFDNLHRHGVPYALERANEIEAELNEPQPKPVDLDGMVELAFFECKKYFANYVQNYSYKYDAKTKAVIGRIPRQSFEVTLEAIKSKARYRELVIVRHTISYLVSKYSNYTVTKIALSFGRDHSTLLASNRAIEDLLDTDKQYRDVFNKIESNFVKALRNG